MISANSTSPSSTFVSLPELDATALAERGGMPHFFDARRPLVLRGIASEWDFIRKWSPDYLVENMGDFQCTLVHDSRPDLARETCSLETYFREHSHLSTMTIVPFAKHPERRFLRDIPLPNPCFTEQMLSAFFFFHSNEGGGSLPHCHQDAFNMLQRGRKRWLMFDADYAHSPAGHEQLAACLEHYGDGHHVSELFDEGLEPLRRAGIRVYEGIQEAGDVVYIPVYFAHAAINLSETLGMVAVLDRPGSPYKTGPDNRYVLPGKY